MEMEKESGSYVIKGDEPARASPFPSCLPHPLLHPHPPLLRRFPNILCPSFSRPPRPSLLTDTPLLSSTTSHDSFKWALSAADLRFAFLSSSDPSSSHFIPSSPLTLMAKSLSSTLSSSAVSARAPLEKSVILLHTYFHTLISSAGPCRPAQTNSPTLCPQIHQQDKVRQNEGRTQHHPRTPTPRRGAQIPTLLNLH